MNIAIIGSGMVGSTLARRLARLGHIVSIANSRGPDTLRQFAAEIGATAVAASDAARSGGIVIVAIPERAVMDLPKDLFAGVAADTVVIDTGNYYPSRDGQITAIDTGQMESRWVSERLGRPVVKAFNTIYFKNVLEKGAPRGAAGRLAVPVAADRGAERETVSKLVDDLGFDPVDAGELDDSWRQQPGTPCYGKELEAPQLKEALAAAERNRIAEYRKAADDAARAFFRPPPR
jgi:predicted dinucleotide-binding enzyme